jgi:hypothetical protein
MSLVRYLLQMRLIAIAAIGALLSQVLWSLGTWLALTHVALAWLLLPAWLMLTYGLLVYGFAIVETSALGGTRAPEFDGALIVAQERSPALRLCLLAIGAMLLWIGLGPASGRIFPAVMGLLVMLWLPGGIALLALEGSIARALDLRVVVGFARQMGWRYLAMIALLVTAAAVIVFSRPYAFGTFFAQMALLICFFATARLLGKQVFDRRVELDLGVVSETERLQERLDADEVAGWKRVFDDIHLAAGAGRLDEAGALLREVLRVARRPAVAMRWFFEELRENGHAALAAAVGRQLVESQTRAGNAAAALDVCDWCTGAVPRFTLTTPAATLTIARAAATTGRHRLAVVLLDALLSAFPESAEAGAAAMLEARICAEYLGETARARRRLDLLAAHSSGIAQTEEYARIERLVGDREADSGNAKR